MGSNVPVRNACTRNNTLFCLHEHTLAYMGIRPCHTAVILSRETKKALFYHANLSLAPMVSTARLGVVKQSFFGLPGQYGRRVTRANTLAYIGVHGREPKHAAEVRRTSETNKAKTEKRFQRA